MIYLDNASTTKVHTEVLNAMLPYFTKEYGNASSIYSFSDRSKNAINKARHIIADYIGAKASEIYFTSGGSEADNWALISTAEMLQSKGKHIITTVIEHHAVLNACKYLESRGFEVTYLDVDDNGRVDPIELDRAIRPDTILISVMFANNEIGTVQPVIEIGKIAKEHGVLFHTDAVQALGQMEINVKRLGIDMMSTSAHKLGAPKGIGFLYIRNGIDLPPLIHGGAQEQGKRGGTENVPYIVGFGKAIEVAKKNEFKLDLATITNYILLRVMGEIENVKLNGSLLHRLPNNLNFSFEGIQSEQLIMLLDAKGFCVSSGSACALGEPSHVLKAIGADASSSIRITINHEITTRDADRFVDALVDSVNMLREINNVRN